MKRHTFVKKAQIRRQMEITHPNVGFTRITESPMATKFDGTYGADSQKTHDCSAVTWIKSSQVSGKNFVLNGTYGIWPEGFHSVRCNQRVYLPGHRPIPAPWHDQSQIS